MTSSERIARVEKLIKSYLDFPKKGIVFRDMFPIMKDPVVFADCISLMAEHVKEVAGSVDVIIGLDSRGFILGPMIAQQLGVAFQPIRKAGKLPGKTVKASFSLEYGSDTFEAQTDAVTPGQRVVLVDDLLATGGTMAAACQLMEKLQAKIVECLVLIELVDLNGKAKLSTPFHSMIKYKDE